MSNKDKLSHIIEERNRLVMHYKEKCEGLEEINMLLKSILFLLLCRGGETRIDKGELSAALGNCTLKIRADDLNYYISVSEACSANVDNCGESHEEEQL